MPPHKKVVILVHPTDFTGKFVFHCHVTFHEDHGMMAVVQVVRKLTAGQARTYNVHVVNSGPGTEEYFADARQPTSTHGAWRDCGLTIAGSPIGVQSYRVAGQESARFC